MSGIRGKDTKPELLIRRELHKRGFRFRLHSPLLPGKPDIALAKYKALIFVHGCFWHGHGCDLFKWPKTRPEFWKGKIGGNVLRDRRSVENLQTMGWRVAIVWECALRRRGVETITDEIAFWLRSSETTGEIKG